MNWYSTGTGLLGRFVQEIFTERLREAPHRLPVRPQRAQSEGCLFLRPESWFVHLTDQETYPIHIS